MSYNQHYSPLTAKKPVIANCIPKLLTWQRPLAPLDSHLTHDSLGPSEPTTQTACRSVHAPLQTWSQSVPILYAPFPPQNCPFPWRNLDPTSNTWFLGPTQVLNPNGISIGSAVFAGLTSVTDWQPDHATWSVKIGCIYVGSTVMWPNNNNHRNTYRHKNAQSNSKYMFAKMCRKLHLFLICAFYRM